MESSSPADSHAALQNLRSAASLANEQGDRAIFLTASLMEAMAHLRSAGPESVELVQRAIAAAWTYQLDADSRIPQLLGLTHILDVACSIRQGNPTQMLNKLHAMQIMMDETLKCGSWSTTNDIIGIPINRTQVNSHTVSHDTRMALGIGVDGRDNLMMAFLNQKDAYSITLVVFKGG